MIKAKEDTFHLGVKALKDFSIEDRLSQLDKKVPLFSSKSIT